MALRQIRTYELAERAAELATLSSREADNAVRAVVGAIAELGDEVRVIDAVPEHGPGEGVIVQRARLDPANPPRLNAKNAAIADEGMIGIRLFRRSRASDRSARA